MLKRLVLPIAICLLTFVHVVSAQTETLTATYPTFPVEQRCISAPTQPPSGWTYPGMILMSGYAGIHAMQADWQTPHVVAPFTIDQRGNYPIGGGQLSPDENWYASPIGENYTEPSFNEFSIVHELRVYSLSGDTETTTLDLTSYSDSLSGQTAWGFSPITWQDNKSLKIGELLIHPFVPEIMDSDPTGANYFWAIDSMLDPRVPSPDFTRVYENIKPYSNSDRNLFDFTTLTGLADVGTLNHVSWRRDSSGFMAQMQQPEQDWHGLGYFDRDGKLIAHILQFDANTYEFGLPISGRSELQWSPDDRYFPFVIVDPNYAPKQFYIIDMQSHEVIDTCLSSQTQPVWSPDGTMFAYLTNASQYLNLVVVDTTTWKAYIVARQSGAQGLFGVPEMVGWRSTTQTQ